jgi:phosphate transport system protein
MSHLDIELGLLKNDTIEMFTLVKSQIAKGKEALLNLDKDLAREIISNERRVNAYELKIDRDCENIFALFNPVAVDLRFVLAVLKINSNLERMGDLAESIAKAVIDVEASFDPELLEISELVFMFDTGFEMLGDALEAFDKDDTKLARGLFKKDEALDKINVNASTIIANFIRQKPDLIFQCLHVLSIIRKLERVGDQTKNVGEEIIFFLEAKVLKHKSQLDKKRSEDKD